jgi:outer membrane protein X
MKYLAVLLLAFAGVTGLRAQEKGDYTFGVNYVVSFDTDKFRGTNYGLSARAQYHILDIVRLQPSLTYFFRRDYLGPVDLSADAHALVHLSESFALYPLAGFGGMIGEAPDSKSRDGRRVTSEAFLNLGGGIDLQLGSNIAGTFEFKVKNAWRESWFHAAIGITYQF